MRQTRRVAANIVIDGDSVISPGVIELTTEVIETPSDIKETEVDATEIDAGTVLRCWHLTQETPHTEWLGGTIEVKKDSLGINRAYHE